MFDDSILESKGTWTNILEHCTQNRVYPTVILYEKLDPNEDEPISSYQHLEQRDIIRLLKDSKRQDLQFDDF